MVAHDGKDGGNGGRFGGTTIFFSDGSDHAFRTELVHHGGDDDDGGDSGGVHGVERVRPEELPSDDENDNDADDVEGPDDGVEAPLSTDHRGSNHAWIRTLIPL